MNNYSLGETVHIMFTTRAFATGIPSTFTTPAVDIYENGSVTAIFAAETLTADFDSLTGLNHLSIVATVANGFESGKIYHAVIETGTVSGVSVVGEVVGSFRIETLAEAITKYSGPRGPGVYLNDAASNTTSVVGVDGTPDNPNSTIASAKATADALNIDRIYLVNDSAITLAATMTDYEFVGVGAPDGNTIALASQDVSNSSFYNVMITGVQGGSARAYYDNCIFGAGTLHLIAYRCGLSDSATGLTVSNNDDQVFDQCWSMVAGNGTPILIVAGAGADVMMRHYSGGIELKSLNATAAVSVETDGQIIFNADCNVNAAVSLRGNMTITDNTAGMSSLTRDAALNKTYIVGSPAGASVSADIAAVKAETALIVADTNELQTDDIPGLIAAVQSDTDDIQTRIPAALAGGKMDSNISAIAGVAQSATNLEASTDTIAAGTASGTPTTTAMISDIGVTVDDQYKGRAVLFASDTTTAALRNQVTNITACTASTNTLTFTQLTTAPVSGETFVIV